MKSLSVAIRMKANEQYFPIVLLSFFVIKGEISDSS